MAKPEPPQDRIQGILAIVKVIVVLIILILSMLRIKIMSGL